MTSTEQISELVDKLTEIKASSQPGEDYHERYKKQPKLFRKLVNEEIKLERMVKRYQRDLRKQIPDLIDWAAFREDKAKLAPREKWRDVKKDLEGRLLRQLEPASQIGKEYGEAQYRVPIPAGKADPEIQTAIRKRSKQTANSVVDTFKDSLNAKLKTVVQKKKIEAQEYPVDIEREFERDLDAVATNDAKAEQIGRTEAIAMAMAALLAYGSLAKSEFKTWRTVPGAEEICADLEGQTIPMNESFDSLIGPVDQPPDPHPNCRCYLDLTN